MYRIKLITIGVMGLLVIFIANSTSAGSIDGRHFLMQEEDLSELGTVIELTSPHLVDRGDSTSSPGFLTDWEEQVAASLVLTTEDSNALISSVSYRFASPRIARSSLNSHPDLVAEHSWTAATDGTHLIEPTITEQTVTGNRVRGWQVLTGLDNENLPTHLLWIQSGVYVTEVYIGTEVGAELLGQTVLNHIMGRIVTGKASSFESSFFFRMKN